LTHLSLSVKDLERTLAFYKRVFGAKVYWRGEGEAQVKTPGCHDVIAFEEKKRGVGKTGGIRHFGFWLGNPKDIDKAVKKRSRAAGSCCDAASSRPASPTRTSRTPTATRSRSGTSELGSTLKG
jgi:catechol 2,3-dioxygenase-like lactoylglutathione lyase family enzyme